MKIFHISDLHIRSDRKHNYQVEVKLYELVKKLGPTDLVICTGDITDDGSEAQYTNALKILTPLTNRILLVPGNHDYGIAGNFYKRECVKRYKVLESLLNYPSDNIYDLSILRIDSNLKTKNPFDFARGKVGFWNRHKIMRFGMACKKAGKVSLVCMHHTPFEEHWALELEDAEDLIRACEGLIDYVLVGHEHKERIISLHRDGTQKGTIWYSAPCLAHGDSKPIEINIDFSK